MIGKLMKYDLRNCFRRFGVLWIAILALAVLNGILMNGVFQKLLEGGGFISSLISFLPTFALVVLLIGTGVLAFVFVCERFYNGLLGDEGYLMFTLPAKVSEHITAKALSALILWVISAVVALLSGILFLLVYDPREMIEALRMLPEALRMVHIPISIPLLIAELLILALVGSASEILKVYASIAIGHLIAGRRKLAAILAYFGLSIAESMGGTAIMSLVSRLGGFSALENLEPHAEYVNGQWEIIGIGYIYGIFGAIILAAAVICVIYFMITKVILSRNLNLE